MLKNLLTLSSLASLLFFAAHARAQANPTAEAKTAFEIGAGYSAANPDYGHGTLQGMTIYGHYDVFRLHLGFEAEAHFLNFNKPEGTAEKSYFFGPRLNFRYKNFRPYGKAMIGVGDLSINPAANGGRTGGTNLAGAFGGGFDYVLTRHIAVRPVDFEYQHWDYLSGLTPMVYTFGVQYRLQ